LAHGSVYSFAAVRAKQATYQRFFDLDENLTQMELKIRCNRIIFTSRYMALCVPKIARRPISTRAGASQLWGCQVVRTVGGHGGKQRFDTYWVFKGTME
jgi:hypothetical protein